MPSKALLRSGRDPRPGTPRSWRPGRRPARPRARPGRTATRSPTTTTTPHRCSGPRGPASRWCEGTAGWPARGASRCRAPDGQVRPLTARHAVVLATGTSAAIPPIPGLREAEPWTSRDVTNLHTVPERIVVIGGGVVGLRGGHLAGRHGRAGDRARAGTNGCCPTTSRSRASCSPNGCAQDGADVRLGADVQRGTPRAGHDDRRGRATRQRGDRRPSTATRSSPTRCWSPTGRTPKRRARPGDGRPRARRLRARPTTALS